MDKYVFFGVVTIDEAVTAFNVEPFHCSRYFFSYRKKNELNVQYWYSLIYVC